jgi:signal transduction histidine kinase
MAHEINQPLNTISLSIDNIIYSIDNKTITEPYLKTKINKVFDNITRIKKIIDHVRTFSRDQDDFVQASFEINTSIQNSISMISEQFSHKEINLSFRPDKNIPPVIGNAYRFEQVMLNMLINAKDAVEEKGKKGCGKSKKKVEILTKLENKQIIVEVKDNGIGIAPEDVDKVLLPFFTTKAPGQGTGLGLSISYGIIKELGGDIEILSKIQSGTTISIKIPVQENTNKKYTLHHVQ